MNNRCSTLLPHDRQQEEAVLYCHFCDGEIYKGNRFFRVFTYPVCEDCYEGALEDYAE